MIEYALTLLKNHGLTEIIINTHYLADQIQTALGDGKRYGVHLTYSFEKEILGTGGGIKRCEPFFQGEDFLVINSDVLIDIDLHALIHFHRARRASATMVLRPHPDPTPAGLQKWTPVWIERTQVKAIGGQKEGGASCLFTGLHILHPKILENVPTTPSSIIDTGYLPMLQSGKPVSAFLHHGFWQEVGTKEQLDQTHQRLKASTISNFAT